MSILLFVLGVENLNLGILLILKPTNGSIDMPGSSTQAELADLDFHCIQKSICPDSAGKELLIMVKKATNNMCTLCIHLAHMRMHTSSSTVLTQAC